MKLAKTDAEVKSYLAPWKSEVVFACKRCQKKLRQEKNSPKFVRLRKWFKNRSRQTQTPSSLHVIDIPCQKICPKYGIVVFNLAQLVNQPATFSIVSSERQLERFYDSSTKVRESIRERLERGRVLPRSGQPMA